MIYRQGKFKKAIVQYNTVIAFTRGLPGSKRGLNGGVAEMAVKTGENCITPEEEAKAVELESTALVNAATCHLKLENPRGALEQATKALELSSDNWKAWLRKGEAQSSLKDFDRARKSLENALEHAVRTNVPEGSQAAIKKEMKQLAIREKQDIQRQKKAFAGLFERANATEVCEISGLKPSDDTASPVIDGLIAKDYSTEESTEKSND